MPTEKIIGYTFLGVGVLFMLFASFQIILTFTGRAQPIQIFKSETQKTSQGTANNLDKTNPDELLKQAKQNPFSLLSAGGGSGISDIIDPTIINNVLNLTVYYFIMQFVLGLGYKFASLGVQMVRPLKISVDQNRISSLLETKKPKPS